MKYRFPILAALVVAGGCVEAGSPTSPLLEQSVFTALGGLQEGETLSLSGAAAADVLLGGLSVPGEFVLVPFHASRAGGSELSVEISGSALGASASLAPPRGPVSSALETAADPGWEMHQELQHSMRSTVQSRLASFSRTRAGASLNRSAVADLSGGSATVGELVDLNTAVFTGDDCSNFDLRTGRVEAIGTRSIVVADVENPTGGFDRADYERFASVFDELVHPTVVDVFSEPADIDDNQRVVIFFTRAVNELTRPEDQGYVGGFFHARDLLPRAGADGCAASNEAEMFYVLVPDPNSEASHIPHQRDDVYEGAVGTIGHEYQHLINASRRIWVNGANTLEAVWLNEGLSHIAEELLFYAASGLEPRSNISYQDVTRSDHTLAAINAFGVQNLVRFGLYLEDVTATSAIAPNDLLETRGAAWAFLRYLADQRVEEQSDLDFFGELANSTTAGYENLGAVTRDPPLDWLQRWGVSIYTDDLVAVGDPLLQQPSWDFRSLLPQLFGTFPLEVRTLAANGSVDLDLVSGTSGYVRFESVAGAASRVSTESGGAPPPDQLRITVVRVD